MKFQYQKRKSDIIEKVSYTNEDLIKIVKELFPNNLIMFMYYSGSIAYRLNDENSDHDVTVVVDGFKGNVHLHYPNLDLIVYGSDCYLDRFQFKKDVPLYSIVKMDDVLTIENNIIFLNPNYLKEYNTYKSVDFKTILKPFLQSFIKFQEVKRANYQIPDKSMYHILRLRGLIDHYLKYGKFEMVVEEPWKTIMMDFKRNWNNDIGKSYLPMIKEQLQYLESYVQRM